MRAVLFIAPVGLLFGKMMAKMPVVTVSVTCVLVTGLSIFQLVRSLYDNIKVVAPESGKYEDNPNECTLFKYLPELKGKVSWRKLGSFPTPISKVRVPLEPGGAAALQVRAFDIHLKREDLSSSVYGGNKVRTLEHLLPCAVAGIRQRGAARAGGRAAEGPCSVTSLGGPGSNQCVAAAAHGPLCGAHPHTLWLMPEEPSDDNGYNLLSCVSMELALLQWPAAGSGLAVRAAIVAAWQGLPLLLRGLPSLVSTLLDPRQAVMMPGGASVPGMLGHLGAALELSAQVEKGEAPAPKQIWLAMGSGCTVSGLVAGVALCRQLGRPLGGAGASGAGAEPSAPALHAVIINHGAARLPHFALRWIVSKFAGDTLAAVAEMGGPDARKHLKDAVGRVVFHSDFAGKYGQWTPAGRQAKQVLARCWASGHGGGAAEEPWLCSCFTSKAFAAMLAHKEGRPREDLDPVIFWSTKSLAQPTAAPLPSGAPSAGPPSVGPGEGGGSRVERVEREAQSMPGFVQTWLDKSAAAASTGADSPAEQAAAASQTLYRRWEAVTAQK